MLSTFKLKCNYYQSFPRWWHPAQRCSSSQAGWEVAFIHAEAGGFSNDWIIVDVWNQWRPAATQIISRASFSPSATFREASDRVGNITLTYSVSLAYCRVCQLQFSGFHYRAVFVVMALSLQQIKCSPLTGRWRWVITRSEDVDVKFASR